MSPGGRFFSAFSLSGRSGIPAIAGGLDDVAQLDAKPGVVQRDHHGLVLGGADIIWGLLRSLVGRKAAGRGGVVPVEEHLCLKDSQLVGYPQGIEQHSALGAGQPEPKPLITRLQAHDSLPFVIDAPAKVLHRVEPRNLMQFTGGRDGAKDRVLVHVEISSRIKIHTAESPLYRNKKRRRHSLHKCLHLNLPSA